MINPLHSTQNQTKRMATKMNACHSILHFSIITYLLLSLPNPSHSADSDPLQDFCIADLKATVTVNGYPCKPANLITSDDFFFSGLIREGNTSNLAGSFVTQGNVMGFPGLNTLGMSMNRIDIAPGGLLYPHIHPRATECGVLIQGKLMVGLITTGNVFYSKNLSVGEVFVIPRGLTHFQMNVGTEKVLVFSAFSSQMPGSIYHSKNLFTSNVPDPVLIKAFQVNQMVIDEIKSGLSQ